MNDHPFFEENYENEDEDNDGEDDGIPFESDPSVVAYLDQEGAEFAAQREQFVQLYGFDHECRCAQDYAEGKMAQVTECYLGLADDALETCARLNWENNTLQGMVAAMVSMNDNLIKTLEESDIGIDADALLEASLLATLENEGGIVDPANVETEDVDGETS